ncbi:MAG TPA: hypothetical protein H9678_08185, partial [Firmicutes bacterium]|nr:hypothetical protein [Bacillota bacterium]
KHRISQSRLQILKKSSDCWHKTQQADNSQGSENVPMGTIRTGALLFFQENFLWKPTVAMGTPVRSNAL